MNMHTCGPTIYDRVHLGNLKTFLWKVKTDEPIKWRKKLTHDKISWVPECSCLSLKYLGKVHIGYAQMFII